MLASAEFESLSGKLTNKQREVVRLLIDCHSTKEIARILGVSPSAVAQRLQGARHRCGSLSRRELQRHFRSTDAEALDALFQPASDEIARSLGTIEGELSGGDAAGPTTDAIPRGKIHFIFGVICGFALGLTTAATTIAITYFTMKLAS